MLHLRALFLILLLCWASLIRAQCNDTYAYNLNLGNPLKANATNKLRIGLLGTFLPTDIPFMNAFAYQINNDPTILPNITVELYSSVTRTSADILKATLYFIGSLQIKGLIAGLTSTDARTAQLGAKIYSVPHMSHVAVSSVLSEKNEYPFFMRTSIIDSYVVEATIALFKNFGWKKALIIYTTDDLGTGYQRLTTAGNSANISFSAISVPHLASKPEDVATAVDNIMQAIQLGDYRIMIYICQPIPHSLVYSALDEKWGDQRTEYVSIIHSLLGTTFLNYMPQGLRNGTIAFETPYPTNSIYEKFISNWQSNPLVPFIPKGPYISYCAVDALMTFILAAEKLRSNGTKFENIKEALLYNTMKNMTFDGTTGKIAYDANGDRRGGFKVINVWSNGTTTAGAYNPITKELSISGPFFWADGTSNTPRDSPYRCLDCVHGTCVTDVGCVCDPGYDGSHCDDKNNSTALFAGIGVAGFVLIAAAFFGVFYYKRQRSKLVKEVADKQRSTINRTDIKLEYRIGRGAAGEVFKGSFRGTEVAVKKIITSTVDKAVIQEFELEVAIMCGLRHPNIILFMGSCFDIVNKEMLLVMEFMARGSLHDVLHNPKLSLNYDMQLHLACQAAQGVNFLHQSAPPIIHRDLKSHNILLDDKWNARISDFGITKFKEETKNSKNSHEKSMGTIYWSAPETLDGGTATEKSDCYSFGVVLWEIFHRQNPYQGRDPVSVAIDVINNNLRPPMDPTVPIEMQDLIRSCWDKDPAKRPDFQEIVASLRSMSMKNPSYVLGGHGSRMQAQAPTGNVYLVNTCVKGAFDLWESKPKEMCDAMMLHNGLIRSNAEMYRGYESSYNFHSFMIAFPSAEDAINFCIATQISLLHVTWPAPLLSTSACARVVGANGELLWNGLAVQMSIYSGAANCQHDAATDRMIFVGPIVEKAQKLLRGIKRGSIVVSDSIVTEINQKKMNLIQSISTQKCGEMNDTSRNANATIHQITITSLQERNYNSPDASNDPHVLVELDPAADELMSITSARSTMSSARSTSWEINSAPKEVQWLVHYEAFNLKESIGKGSMGDYQRASWAGKDVAIKTFVNQKLKEPDLLRLLSDAAIMHKMTHANLLQFYAVCLDSNHLAMVSEFMPRGNLKEILADSSIPLSLAKRMKFAHDVACGMAYLTNHPNQEMQKHDNLKSNNILIGKEWEAKVSDYGQSNLKDLARTMTSVGSVAWTAPEILIGEASTPKIATYSFGIILWELYTRQVPYTNEHPIRVVSKILAGYRPPIPAGCPPMLSELITACLNIDPDERPSWSSIMATLSSLMTSAV